MNIEEKRIKRNFNTSLYLSFLYVIIGLFLFIKPDITISLISYFIGGILILIGVISIIKYFSSLDNLNVLGFDLTYGILLLIAGIFLVLDTSLFSKIINIILGIWIIVGGITKFQYSLMLRKTKNKDSIYTLLVSFLIFVWGIVLLLNPFKSALLITQTIGVFLIIYSVLDIIANFILRRNINDLNNYLNRD